MSAISKAKDEIKFQIPKQVLDIIFSGPAISWRNAYNFTSIDQLIMEQVIRPRVLVDCNLIGGQTVIIQLDGITPNYVDNFESVYHIPKRLSMNRSIISVLSVGYMPYANAFNSTGIGYGNVAPGSVNELTNVGNRIGDSFSGIPPVSNAQAWLIAENTVLLRDQFKVTSAYYLRCVIENDDNMNNISPRSWITFADLCVLAVKSYIYNTGVVLLDRGYLEGGQELGSIKTYIESLSDAEINYRTYLMEKWRPTAFCNDSYAYDRFIKLQVSPGV